MDKQTLETIIFNHYEYLKKNDFLGWDVFDGLNSKVFRTLPFYRSRLLRLAWIQFFKRSPVNLRRLLLIQKGDNPKALALFISGLVHLYSVYKKKQYLETALLLYQRLMQAGTKTDYGIGWGYNFPWQARAFYVPEFKPNMIASVFAGHALLDLSAHMDKKEILNTVEQIARFLRNELILFEQEKELCFAYIPGEKAIVHNANLLGAAFLSRVYSITGDVKLKNIAEKAVRYSVNAQRSDGAWVYGERGHHQWVDNFHTGYNLTALYQYQKYTNDKQFEMSLKKGLDFHIKNHFTKDYLPKYTDKKVYPLDIHCFSQAILTAVELKPYLSDWKVFLQRIIDNVLHMMYDNGKNYFYYQRTKYYTTKIPYIRWAQAWMFYSLITTMDVLDD